MPDNAGGFGDKDFSARGQDFSQAAGGDFVGSVDNTAKNTEERQAVSSSPEEGDPGGAFGLGLLGPVASASSSLSTGFIGRKVQDLIDDPLAALINFGASLVPGGQIVTLANAAANLAAGPLDKHTSFGSALSAGIRAAADVGFRGSSNQQQSLSGDAREALEYAAATGPAVDGSSQTPPYSPASSQQPREPLAQPTKRVSNPYAPLVPLQSSVGSIWL